MTATALLYITCILFLGVILVGLYLSRDYKNVSTKWFAAIIYSTIGYLVIATITELLEGKPEYSTLSFVLNLLSFLAIDAIVVSFLGYITSYLDVKHSKSSKILLCIITLSTLIRILLVIILAFTNHLFAIEAGKYVEKDLLIVPYIMSALIMVELIALIILNRRNFAKRHFVVVIIYEIIPIPAIIAELIINSSFENANVYYLTGLALTLSVSLIYLLIQDSTLEETRMKQLLLEEISNTDLLTGLNNRRAYYQEIHDLDKSVNVGVLFCDINGLKYTNDHFGHAAGDEFIKSFATILCKSYKKDHIFRISGDEFIVFIPDIKPETFDKNFESFMKIVIANKHIAAVGKSYGSANCINKLIAEAEAEMYRDKAANGIKRI